MGHGGKEVEFGTVYLFYLVLLHHGHLDLVLFVQSYFIVMLNIVNDDSDEQEVEQISPSRAIERWCNDNFNCFFRSVFPTGI